MNHKVGYLGQKGDHSFYWGGGGGGGGGVVESKRQQIRRERKEHSNLLSPILEVLFVGIHRAKSESSSTRRGLRVGTKKEGFHRRSRGGDFGKSKFSGLGDVLETSFGSTTLQEVGEPNSALCCIRGCLGAKLCILEILRGCLG